MNKTDTQLKQDVENELRSDPRANAAQMRVNVEDGVVSLLGVVDTYAEKLAGEAAARRVGGVRAVVQDITVKILSDHKRSDSDLATAVQSALVWDVLVPKTVIAKVQSGSVTLQGEVTWKYQRDAAERAVRYLTGVVAVHNAITLKPQASPEQVKEKILAALARQATRDANSIRIETSGGKVTLTGHASSWQTIEDAANAAWSVPGVTEVIDQVKMSMTF